MVKSILYCFSKIYTLYEFLFTSSSLISKTLDPTDVHRINYISEQQQLSQRNKQLSKHSATHLFMKSLIPLVERTTQKPEHSP